MQPTPMRRMLTHITATYDVRPTRLVGVSVGSALVATRPHLLAISAVLGDFPTLLPRTLPIHSGSSIATSASA